MLVGVVVIEDLAAIFRALEFVEWKLVANDMTAFWDLKGRATWNRTGNRFTFFCAILVPLIETLFVNQVSACLTLIRVLKNVRANTTDEVLGDHTGLNYKFFSKIVYNCNFVLTFNNEVLHHLVMVTLVDCKSWTDNFVSFGLLNSCQLLDCILVKQSL